MRNARKPITALVAVLGLLVFSSAPAWAGQGYEKVTGEFGKAGSGPGDFNEPTSIAVNDETEEVYVLDSGNDRVEWFSPEGAGQFKFKGEFDGEPGHKFLKPTGIAVDNSCASQTPVLTEAECKTFDPSNGDVYVADTGQGHEVVDKFSATGKYEGQLTGGKCENPANPEELPPCSESKVVPFSDLFNVAVDSSGNVWVDEGDGPISEGQQRPQVDEFGDTGSAIATFTLTGIVTKLVRGADFAVDSSGDLFMAIEGHLYEFDKAEAYNRIPIEEAANIQPAALAIISSTGNLLVDQGASIELFKSPFLEGVPLLTFPATGLSESGGIAVNGAKGEGTIYATQRGEDDVDVLESGKPGAPEIVPGSESASSVEQFAVKFAAGIDSENRGTTYSFQYSYSKETVEEGNGEVAGGGTTPAEFGAAEVTSPVIEEGIRAAETIYYRVVAENEESKGTPTYGKVEAYTKLPLIDNEKVSGLTSTSAELEATLNPVFERTRPVFEYSTEATGQELEGTITKVPGLETGPGGAPEPIGTEITGLQPGQTYYYRLVAENEVTKETSNANAGAPVKGPIEQVTPYAAPAVVTGEAQNITGTAATLSGEVNPERTEAKYYFAYIGEAGFRYAIAHGAANPEAGEAAYQKELAEGARSPYAEGDTTATFSVPASASPQAVGPIPADGLLPGVTYHYALVAVNKFAIQTIGPDHTFATAAGRPPLVSTGGASGVSQNTATLSGTVTTNGLQTNYGFEIGTGAGGGSISYGPATGLGAIGGSLTEEVHVTLGELAPGTTYYYRVTATNADGTEKGQPESFTTPGFPSLIAPPSSPPLIAYVSPGFPAEAKGSGTGTTKTLTNKQKLAKALKQCKREKSKSKRQHCERQAHEKYDGAKKAKKKKK